MKKLTPFVLNGSGDVTIIREVALMGGGFQEGALTEEGFRGWSRYCRRRGQGAGCTARSERKRRRDVFRFDRLDVMPDPSNDTCPGADHETNKYPACVS